jgi:hypothetical protein
MHVYGDSQKHIKARYFAHGLNRAQFCASQLPSRVLANFQCSPMVSKHLSHLTAFLVMLAMLSTSFAFPGMQVPNKALVRRQPQGGGSGSSQGEGASEQGVDPPPPPGPPTFTGTKLVNDADHPWQPLRPGDIRGPCPALNTLASHGVSLIHESR